MMMFFYLWFPMFLFFSGVIMYMFNCKHLLIMLLSLEFIVMSLFFFLMIYLSMNNYENYFSLLFLSFSVCEGSLGLSLLIMMIRTHGNDYLNVFSLL